MAKIGESLVRFVPVHIPDNRPPNGLAKRYRHRIADLLVHIRNIPADTPIVGKALNGLVLLHRKRAVLTPPIEPFELRTRDHKAWI